MLLHISTGHRPLDLPWLLAKNPANAHRFDLSVGEAHVLFEECSETRCALCLYVEVDAVGLVRGRKRGDALSLGAYVNERPYAGGTLLGIALNRAFRSALAGKCKDRPELLELEWPLEIRIPTLRVRGSERFLRACFEPLGYQVQVDNVPLDPNFEDWGPSRFMDTTLRIEASPRAVLSHLVVLLPVLADDKHYWVSTAEVDKLMAKGGAWLAEHPEHEQITSRFLKGQRSLVRQALERLVGAEAEADAQAAEDALERPMTLNQRRMQVFAEVLGEQPGSVIDLGCGEGRLLYRLAKDKRFTRVTGADVSARALEIAERRVERIPERLKPRVSLIQASLVYRDARFEGYDAATLVEVIEHLELSRLPALEQVVFAHARPGRVLVSTPNAEYNQRFEGMAPGAMRHRDHRFEWSRDEFRAWARRVADEHGYTLRYLSIGEEDPELGPPTQMVVFQREGM